jgi:hypothetical protein
VQFASEEFPWIGVKILPENHDASMKIYPLDAEWISAVRVYLADNVQAEHGDGVRVMTEGHTMSSDGKSGKGGKQAFGLVDFLARLGAALVLVLITYNPSGWSFLHWVKNSFVASELGPLQFLVGAALIAGWAIFIVATRNALGTVGLVIAAAILAALVWLFVDLGWLGFDSVAAVSWVLLICLSILLAIGLSWAHIWRRMSGQLEIADEE